jgi:hypothetical protein
MRRRFRSGGVLYWGLGKTMRPGIAATAALILAGTISAHAQSDRWISGSNGYLPPDAVQGGHEANGTPLYVCRARHLGGVHIGKFRADWRGCNIPYGGRELTLNSYQVLVR